MAVRGAIARSDVVRACAYAFEKRAIRVFVRVFTISATGCDFETSKFAFVPETDVPMIICTSASFYAEALELWRLIPDAVAAFAFTWLVTSVLNQAAPLDGALPPRRRGRVLRRS